MGNTITVRGETVAVIKRNDGGSSVFTESEKLARRIAEKSSQHGRLHLRVGRRGVINVLPFGADVFDHASTQGERRTVLSDDIGVFQKP